MAISRGTVLLEDDVRILCQNFIAKAGMFNASSPCYWYLFMTDYPKKTSSGDGKRTFEEVCREYKEKKDDAGTAIQEFMIDIQNDDVVKISIEPMVLSDDKIDDTDIVARFHLLSNPNIMLEIPIRSFGGASFNFNRTIYATVIKYMLRITTKTMKGRTKTYYLYQYRNTSPAFNVYTDKFEQLMTLRYILHKDLLKVIREYSPQNNPERKRIISNSLDGDGYDCMEFGLTKVFSKNFIELVADTKEGYWRGGWSVVENRGVGGNLWESGTATSDPIAYRQYFTLPVCGCPYDEFAKELLDLGKRDSITILSAGAELSLLGPSYTFYPYKTGITDTIDELEEQSKLGWEGGDHVVIRLQPHTPTT